MNRTVLIAVAIACGVPWAFAQDAGPPASDEAAIRKTVESYVAAFNQGDARNVATHWTADAEFVTPGGEILNGQAAIETAFKSFLEKNRGAVLEVEIAEIRLTAPGAAAEEGTARVTLPDKTVTTTTYTAQYVKEDGKWRLKILREAAAPSSHYEQLKELEWMIGEWIDQDDKASVRTVCRWTKNKNFITRSFAVSIAERIELEGTQVIGWDPAQKVIRSWLFDSDGGFGVGLWKREGNRWSIRSLQVQSGGRKASAVNTLTHVDDNAFTWESANREVDGEILPNIKPVTVVRKASGN